MAELRLALLGGFEVRLDGGGPVTIARHKVEALLSYLAMPPGQLHRRDKLAALLWADAPSARARQSLRQALAELRVALAPAASCLRERRDAVVVDPATIDVDVVTFERLVRNRALASLEQAAALYRGDLLEGLRVAEPPFEEWLMAERARLRELAVDALAMLLSHHVRSNAAAPAVQTALRLLSLDPLQESVHRTLMRLYLRLGRRGAGLRQYEECLDLLRRELGAEPEPETRRLYVELLQATAVPEAEDATIATGVATSGPAGPLHSAPLVGRDAELARLGAVYEDARRGGHRIVTVLGEAGIGKTRLVEAFVATLSDREVRVLVGRAHETESELPFGLWIHMFRDGRVLPDIPRLIDRRSPARTELARLFPELADAAAPMAVSTDRAPLFEAMGQVVDGLAPSGLLLVLEDLHWADEASLRVLAFLLHRAATGTLMVVLSAQPEEMPGAPVLRQLLAELEREGRGLTLSLSALSRNVTTALTRALAPIGIDAAAMDALAEEVWRVSEGNPFLVVETMRALQEGDATQVASIVALPQRARETISRRLERLTDRARRLAGVAAAIGRDFDFRVLQRSAGVDPVEAAEAVEELVGRRILHVVGERLDVSHGWIRRAIYERLLPPVRPALHASIARALEAFHADRPEDVDDQLAYHYARATEPAKAVLFLRRYAAAASRRYALDEAVRALHEAFDHAARLSPADQARATLEIHLELAFVLSVVGRFEEILERLLPLQATVEALGDPAVMGSYFSRIALTHSVLGHHARADVTAHRALAEAERASDRASQGTARYVLAVQGFVTGQPSAGLAHAREAVALLERAGDHGWLAQACWILGCNHFLLGNFDAAIEAGSRMETIAQALGDQGRRATAAWTVALVQATRGDLEAALSTARRAVERSPDTPNRAAATAVLAMIEAESGKPSPTIPLLEHAVSDLERFRIRQATAMLFLAEALRMAGRLAEAREVACRTRETAERMSFAWATACAERALGRIALARADTETARRHLRAALGMFAGMSARFEVGRTHLDLGLAAHPAGGPGEAPEAVEHVREAHRQFLATGAPRYVERAERLAAELPCGP
jgi:DNA-binding SARP family transcriptional activator